MATGEDCDELYGDLFGSTPAAAPSAGESAPGALVRMPCSAAMQQAVPVLTVAEAFHDHDLKELRSELETCRSSMQVCMEQLSCSQHKSEELQAERAVLVRNISVLFRTATLELQRKATEIKTLRQDLDKMRRASAASASNPAAGQKQQQQQQDHDREVRGGRQAKGDRPQECDGNDHGSGAPRSGGKRERAEDRGRGHGLTAPPSRHTASEAPQRDADGSTKRRCLQQLPEQGNWSRDSRGWQDRDAAGSRRR